MEKVFDLPSLKMEGYVVVFDDPYDFSGRFPINNIMLDDGAKAIQRFGRISHKRAKAMAIECWIAMSKANADRVSSK